MIVNVELNVKGSIERTPMDTVSMNVFETEIPGMIMVIPYIAAKLRIDPMIICDNRLLGRAKNFIVWLTSVFESPKITIIIIQ